MKQQAVLKEQVKMRVQQNFTKQCLKTWCAEKKRESTAVNDKNRRLTNDWSSVEREPQHSAQQRTPCLAFAATSNGNKAKQQRI